MDKFREVKLPSGAVLKVKAAPFSDAKALYHAVLEEGKDVDISNKVEMPSLLKSVFLAGFASKKIEECLWACFEKCIYNYGKGDLKIDKDSFEPVQNREDYAKICLEVAEENIRPFVKGLYAEYLQILMMIESIQASRPKTTTS